MFATGSSIWERSAVAPVQATGSTTWAGSRVFPVLSGDQTVEAALWAYGLKIPLGEQQLPPFPGDPDGAAVAINHRGEVAGIYGTCDQAVGRFSAKHAVLWRDGKVTDLGNLGGAAWNTPFAINNDGDMVGFSRAMRMEPPISTPCSGREVAAQTAEDDA